MKKSLKKYLALCVLILATILACQKEDQATLQDSSVTTETTLKNADENSEQIAEVLREYKGREIEGNFLGRVIDEANQPIMGATVSLGGEQRVTDENGMVVFIGVTVNENFAYAKASAYGFSNGSRVMVPTGQNSFTIKLFNMEDAQHIDSSGGEVTIVTENDQEVFIEFNDGFMDENGNTYNGDVFVTAKYLDPLAEDTANTMPGDLYGIDANFQEVALGSYGMINVELRGNNGEKLQITNPAVIRIPVHPSQMGTAPSQVPMWSFNEDTGVWFEETTAYNTGSHFEATVSHFSFWNCDAPFPLVNLTATVIDSNTGLPISGLTVTITYNGFSRNGTTDANGVVSGKIPSNQVMTITVTDQCGSTLYTNTNFGPFNSTINITIPVALATPLINVSGNILDCSGAPVTNGYVIYRNTAGQILNTYLVTAGTHVYSGIACATPINIVVEGIDNATGQATGATIVTANPNATANLLACGGTPVEYIRYSVNGNPFQYEIISPGGGVQAPSFVSLKAESPNGQTYIFGSAVAPGTYPFNTNISNTTSYAMEVLGDVNGIDPVATNTVGGAMQFTVINIGAVGSYMDVNFVGNYVDRFGTVRTINGTAHIIRDY